MEISGFSQHRTYVNVQYIYLGSQGKNIWLTVFLSWGLPQPGCVVQRPKPATSPVSPTSPNDHENPWTRRSSESQTMKFSAIVEDEIQQRESFVRATNKPLGLIQVFTFSLKY